MTAPLRSDERHQRVAATPEKTEPGLPLIAEAEELMLRRRWRSAVKVLLAARRLRPDDRAIDEMMAVSAAHAGNKTERDRSVGRLAEPDGQQASGWTAIAQARLATHDFGNADRAARQALDLEPESAGGWQALGASFAGLGWFDEATRCIESAEARQNTMPDRSGGGEQPIDFDRWQLGRAVNQWGMTTRHTLTITMVAIVAFRLLGAAFVITAPLVLREYRVSRLDPRFKEAADLAWAGEHRLKLVRGLLVLLVVACWIALMVLAGS